MLGEFYFGIIILRGLFAFVKGSVLHIVIPSIILANILDTKLLCPNLYQELIASGSFSKSSLDMLHLFDEHFILYNVIFWDVTEYFESTLATRIIAFLEHLGQFRFIFIFALNFFQETITLLFLSVIVSITVFFGFHYYTPFFADLLAFVFLFTK